MDHTSNNGIKITIKRVEKERNELKTRIVKLNNTIDFIDKTPYITDEHKTLLKIQLTSMQQYIQILDRRLELFEQDLKED